jgi:nicotinate-nucleotide pyrophosphorylase (carboxylating)
VETAALPLDVPPLFDRLRGALLEDLTAVGDITSQALVPEHRLARADFVAKSDGVLCGVRLLPLIFQMAEQLVSQSAAERAWTLSDAQDAAAAGKTSWESVQTLREQAQKQDVAVNVLKKDGEPVSKGDVLATVSGQARAILAGERTALNLISHLSGIATQTAALVARIRHTRANVLDTRKTLPQWRDLQKYAVVCGGGKNHRKGLYDQILIKDNHLALWGEGDPAGAVRAAQSRFPGVVVEIEVTTSEQFRNVLENASPDIILIDNFTPEQAREAVHLCEGKFAGSENEKQRPQIESSGGITLESIVKFAEAGVDRISVGALTHTILPMDVSLEMNVS